MKGNFCIIAETHMNKGFVMLQMSVTKWVVVFWLPVLFVSFGLFAPRNPAAIVVLLLPAISVTDTLYLILDLDHPFSGLMQISSEPLRGALSVLRK